jgi:hypothetical protein
MPVLNWFERVATLRFIARCNDDKDLVAACDEVFLANFETDSEAARKCREGFTRWQSVDLPTDDEGHLVINRDQLEDLRYYCVLASDWSGWTCCSKALSPFYGDWPPSQSDKKAAQVCARAWNARAARLRA